MSEIKLATYNLNHSRREEAVLGNIQTLSEDGINLFCLQEVRLNSDREFIGDKILQRLGPDWKGQFFLSLQKNFDYGLGIVWNSSELDALDFKSHSLPRLERLTPFERTFALFRGDYPEPIQRGALSGIFSAGSEQFRVTNVHLDWHGGILHRMKQREHLARHISANSFDGGDIICGDFNSLGLFTAYGAHHLSGLLGDGFVNSVSTFQFTTTFFQHLDHIFVKRLEIDGAEVHKLPGSDHYPLSARLRFK